jgi:uncharacterized delta-60 repeat protein
MKQYSNFTVKARLVNRARSTRRVRCESLEGRRLLSAGDPDAAFSGDGWADITFPGAAFEITDTAFQLDGKVIAAGHRGNYMAVARLNADGTLDASFGDQGLFESARRPVVTSVAVQGDGKIVLGLGDSGNLNYEPELQVARLLADGSDFDSGFGYGGIAQLPDQWSHSFTDDVVVQRDGKIVAAGWVLTGLVFTDHDFAVARYTADGLPDTSFAGGDGVTNVGFGGDEIATAVTIDYNDPGSNPLYGTIVVVGQNALNSSRFTLIRLRPDGSLDPLFSGDGKLVSPDLSGAGQEHATDVVVQPGGKIVVAGSAVTADPNFSNFLVARYLSNGTLDSSFGLASGGSTELGLGTTRSEAESLTTGYLGGLLVGGSSSFNMAVLALTPSGQVDTRFSGDGIVRTSIPGRKPGIASTGSLIAPIRRLVIAGGSGRVGRYVDVGSVVSIRTEDSEGSEAGTGPASFIISHGETLSTPLRVFVGTGGTATPPNTFPVRPRDYNGTNISFGNGVSSSTYVDIPANQSSVTVTITPVDDSTVEGDETAVFTIGTNAAYDFSPPPSTTLAIRDNDVTGPPIVSAAEFLFATAPQRVTFRFSQDVGASLGSAGQDAFELTGPVGMPSHEFIYDRTSNTATLAFNGILPDGNYTARAIASEISNSAGQHLAADHVLNFVALAGDANGDRSVNVGDLGILASNWQQSPRTFSQGDFDYSGTVDVNDLGILASHWQQSLSPSAPASRLGGNNPWQVVRGIDAIDELGEGSARFSGDLT